MSTQTMAGIIRALLPTWNMLCERLRPGSRKWSIAQRIRQALNFALDFCNQGDCERATFWRERAKLGMSNYLREI